MKKQFVLYTQTNPFRGYIHSWGMVDTEETPDGSTLYEYIQRKLATNSDLRLHLRNNPLDIISGTPESKKFNPETSSLIGLEAGDITPSAQQLLTATAQEQAINTNLPTWSAVSNAVDSISNLAEAKAFLKKLSRVVYWLAKNTED